MGWLDALRRWARSDRIRMSPADGRLLRLRTGSCVRVGETFARVVARRVRRPADDAGAGEVEYACEGAGAAFHLRVRAAATGAAVVALVARDGTARDVDARDVEAFG